MSDMQAEARNKMRRAGTAAMRDQTKENTMRQLIGIVRTGRMGTALTGWPMSPDHRVVVWNRTADATPRSVDDRFDGPALSRFAAGR